jgi:hypothetical protein
MVSSFVSIRQIISTVYRTLGSNSEINEIDAVEWGAEALGLIGAYSQYDIKPVCLELTNGKARLPLGFYKLVDINYKNRPLYWATQTNARNYQCSDCQIPVCTDGGRCDLTFYLNDSYLITNISDTNANVCMNIMSVHVDEDGYPMIPDDPLYSKAVSSYIIKMNDYQEWRKGKITDKVFEKSERDWLYYVNSARGAANMPNTAQLENLKNITTRLMPMRQEYGKGFSNINSPERLNISHP